MCDPTTAAKEQPLPSCPGQNRYAVMFQMWMWYLSEAVRQRERNIHVHIWNTTTRIIVEAAWRETTQVVSARA